MKNKFLRRIAIRYLNGTLSEQLRKLFDAYLDDKQVNASPFATDKGMHDRIFERVNNKISSHETRSRKTFYYWGAAAIILLSLVALLTMNDLSRSPEVLGDFTITTKKGEKKKVVLPDGSIVMLNAQSELKYLQDFGEKVRKVSLKGEAYFDVKHDSRRPFIVHSQKIDIKVLGTLFNVKAYVGETTEASLIRGSVQIFLPESRHALLTLKPNERFILRKPATFSHNQSLISTGKNFAVTLVRPPVSRELNEPAPWVQNQLSFDDQGFSEVAALLNRWYNVEIIIENPLLLNHRFTGTFNDIGLVEVLNSLQTIEHFNYRKEGDKIRIY